jgi:hypothetical protein
MASSNETISTIRLLSTAQRSLTPSKIPVRNSTPQRATSNPRNISAGKTRLAAALSETEVHRATSRSASRRKQRRWENQNIFSPEVNDILMQGLEDEENHVRIRKPLFKVEMRSAFRELFEPKNAAALETFRMCAESLVTQEKANQKHLSCGEKAWLRVEKRLRQILIESVGKNVDIIAFIADLEELITTYVKQEEIDESYEKRIDSKVLASLLIRVPSISPENELEVELKDSAFHRLLLHSVCQYHGLVSKVCKFVSTLFFFDNSLDLMKYYFKRVSP